MMLPHAPPGVFGDLGDGEVIRAVDPPNLSHALVLGGAHEEAVKWLGRLLAKDAQ